MQPPVEAEFSAKFPTENRLQSIVKIAQKIAKKHLKLIKIY